VEKDEFGRPSALNEEQQRAVIARIDSGISISAIAREFSTTRQTVLRAKQHI
jgi:putative DNA-invertase from lambdoid prophage Rac